MNDEVWVFGATGPDREGHRDSVAHGRRSAVWCRRTKDHRRPHSLREDQVTVVLTKLVNTAAVGSAVTCSSCRPVADDDLVLSDAVGVGKKRDRAAQGAFHQPTGALRLVLCPVPEVVTYQPATALPVHVVGKDRGGFRTTLDLRQRGVCAQKTAVSL